VSGDRRKEWIPLPVEESKEPAVFDFKLDDGSTNVYVCGDLHAPATKSFSLAAKTSQRVKIDLTHQKYVRFGEPGIP
jgi:hypothetical protein